MNRKRLNLLMAVSAISFVLTGLMSTLICYVICSENSQWLTHPRATMVLGALNGLPTMIALAKVFQFASALKRRDGKEKEKGFFLFMKKIFYVQAAYTLASVFVIGEMENAGPPFYLFATLFIISSSLTLALLFDTLDHLVCKEGGSRAE